MFDEEDNLPMLLRRRFVLGAAEWMAGKNGSLRNDKEVFDYSDAEWEYIWTTMLADGAWAVPAIKDGQGNIVKGNYAPEMMIKYIAHDLRCNILVIDLVLNIIQFVSGNHLKSDNVVFDSPLLMYCTGGHFQSVHQEDHEFFIEFAKNLESVNVGVVEDSNNEIMDGSIEVSNEEAQRRENVKHTEDEEIEGSMKTKKEFGAFRR